MLLASKWVQWKCARSALHRLIPCHVARFVISETVDLPTCTECRDGSVRLDADGSFTYYYTRTMVTPDYTGETERQCTGRWEWIATRRLRCAATVGSCSKNELFAERRSEHSDPWVPTMEFTVVDQNPVTLSLSYKTPDDGVHSRLFVKRAAAAQAQPTASGNHPDWAGFDAAATEYAEALAKEAVADEPDDAGTSITSAADVVGRYVYHETIPYEVGTGSGDGEVVFYADGRFNYSYTRTREDTHYSGTTLRTATGTYAVTAPGCVTCYPTAGRRKKTEVYANERPVVEVGPWTAELTFFSVRTASAWHIARVCLTPFLRCFRPPSLLVMRLCCTSTT